MTQKESKHVPNAYNRYCKRVVSHNALQTLLTLDLYCRGPEDDSERVE